MPGGCCCCCCSGCVGTRNICGSCHLGLCVSEKKEEANVKATGCEWEVMFSQTEHQDIRGRLDRSQGGTPCMPCGECGSLSTCACHACRSRAGTIHTAAAACGGTCSWPSCTHRGAGTRCRWAPCPQCTREDTRTCLPSGSVPAPRTCTPCPSCAHLLCVLPGLSSRFLVHHPLVGCMARSFSLVLLAFFLLSSFIF